MACSRLHVSYDCPYDAAIPADRFRRYRRHVALKVFITSAAMGKQLDDELNMYKRLEKGSKKHPGRDAVRSLHDTFDIDGPHGQHRCLVHPPLWESVLTFLQRNPVRRLPTPVLAFVLKRLFLALDYLHTECKVIHTGLCSAHHTFFVHSALIMGLLKTSKQTISCLASMMTQYSWTLSSKSFKTRVQGRKLRGEQSIPHGS